MSCCITPRQLHNSPVCSPSFASGQIHILSRGSDCPEQTQPAGIVWGQMYVWYALLLMTSIVFTDTDEAEWKQCQCCSPPANISVVLRGIIRKLYLCTKESVCHQQSYVYLPSSCRGPSLQVRSRLLWSSPYPEAGAGHPPVPEEGQPGQALHLSHLI